MGPRIYRNACPAGEPHSRTGWTLLETLLALVIAGLLLAVVFTFYHTVSLSVSEQPLRRSAFEEADRALAQLGADLAGLYAAEGSACAFDLKLAPGSGSSNSEAAFCTTRMPAGETDLQWAEIRQVAYRVLPADEPAGVLVCEEQPLAGPGAPGPPVTNLLARGVEQFSLQVFDGADWQKEWSGDRENRRPQAVRMGLTLRRGEAPRSFQAVVYIPAGQVFTSGLQRAQAAP